MTDNAATASAETFTPRFRNHEEMIGGYRKELGEQIANILEQHRSTQSQADLVEKLKAAGVNGQSEAIAREYLEHNQEFERSEGWMSRWTNNVKSATGTVLDSSMKAGGWLYNKIKEHPYLTAAVILGAAGIIAWQTGLGASLIENVQKWIGAAGDTAAGEHIGEVVPAVTPEAPIQVPPAQPTVDVPPAIPEYNVPQARLPRN